MSLPMPFRNPATHRGHSGVDFPQRRGAPILASGPGTVLRTSHNVKGGYWTVIAYDALPGDEVGYAHQDHPVTVVRAGARVVEGTVIGFVGSLGANSTGPHLHVEVLNRPGDTNALGIFDRNRVVGQTPAAAGTPARKDTLQGLRWTGIQRMLKADFGYRGAIDNISGAGTIR